MTTTPTKAQLPLSEIPITFKDGKIEISTDLSVGILDDGTIGFHSEEVTLENLLGRVCTVDLYPEAIAAVHWTLKSVLATESKLAQQELEETGNRRESVVISLVLLNRAEKFLNTSVQNFNVNDEVVDAFLNCIVELTDSNIGNAKSLCHDLLDAIEDFLAALGNYQCESKDGETFNKEFIQQTVFLTQTTCSVGCARATLSDLF